MRVRIKTLARFYGLKDDEAVRFVLDKQDDAKHFSYNPDKYFETRRTHTERFSTPLRGFIQSTYDYDFTKTTRINNLKVTTHGKG